ncbi:expressed unknown protein [Seminavis robusta]|uniref:Uncharacterized protein n=1 Tax=Seminavis robusta TaxID=568900 RepID=A0A9N8D820_9STRA|nr:expressed unknown protein [Seminavis robusta]|eukprot:Sro35_g022200.1 n/a (133) ;mRNA; f:21169-21567
MPRTTATNTKHKQPNPQLHRRRPVQCFLPFGVVGQHTQIMPRTTTNNNKQQQTTTNNNKQQQTTTNNNKQQQTTTNNNKQQQTTTNNNKQQQTKGNSRAVGVDQTTNPPSSSSSPLSCTSIRMQVVSFVVAF